MRWLIATGCATALLAAACGGARPHATGPRVPHALAYRLAAESDAVAAALDRGDSCAAHTAAGRLRADLTASIARVPAALQEPLSNRVNDLAAALPACTPPATTPAPAQQQHTEPGEHEKHEKHEKHGKHKGKGDD